MIHVDSSLDPHWAIVEAHERVGNGKREFAFHSTNRRLLDGIVLNLYKDNMLSWTGLFSRGGSDYCGAAICAEGKQLVAISNGALYIVDLENPERYKPFGSESTQGMFVVSDARCVVAYDYSYIWGFGTEGLSWMLETEADGIQINNIFKSKLKGKLDIPGRGAVPFVVDASIGKLIGN